MRIRFIIIFIICCVIFVLFPPLPKQNPLTAVFRITEDPAVIVRGTNGSALTVNISFGDVEVEQWIQDLTKPYPLLFVDMEWVERFPETVELIKDKKIPVGLLGNEGKDYEQNTPLFVNQIERFEQTFGMMPLWFRTKDEVFPLALHTMLWEAEINALGSSVTWQGGNIPPVQEGEILSIPHHRENRIEFTELKKLYDGRTFITVEEMLFQPKVKLKKIPE